MSTHHKGQKKGHQWLVRVHPRRDTNYVSQGRAVLATNLDGAIEAATQHGLFVHETRLLSLYRYLLDGKPPRPIALSNVEQHSWLGYYGAPAPGVQWTKDTGSGKVEPVSENTIEIRVSRTVGLGIHEDVDITNWTLEKVRFQFAIEVDADFADQAEIEEREQKGKLTRSWRQRERAWELTFDYKAENKYDHQGNRGIARIHRAITLAFEHADSPPRRSGRRVIFDITLAPRAQWHVCVRMTATIDGEELPPLYGCREFFGSRNQLDEARQEFLQESTAFTTPETPTLSGTVISALEQAKRDLISLRLFDLDHPPGWTMAAGLPIYIALFGRDTLTAAWQAALTSPNMIRATLEELARWQGTEVNDWRDEQPGKMLHEAHTGPLAALYYNPRSRYYGAATTSSFYSVVLSELWHWTGDKELVRPLLEPALRALEWKDRYTDLDGDGFYEYLSRSEQGNKNQGWKDSGDAIVYPDGRQVSPPLGTCEEQAFVYIAKLHLSEVLWWLDEKDLAKRLYHEAQELKKRFNEKYWMEDEGFFAMGLDSQAQTIRSIGSNPGHCLACGIVDEALVERTARRLLAPDLFSGWGIRTLSSEHPAFDPFSYHRGSVWPVEHGSFAFGMMRYGLWRELETISRAMFESTELFDFHQLPECFSGHQRDSEHPFPALYPKANAPQAWSASALFALVQAMLGIYPYAPLNTLLLDPHLPEWLPEITLENLRVGKASVTIHFVREKDGGSDYKVLDKRGTLHVLRQPSPWSMTASFGERLKDALTSLLPGK